LRWIRLYLDHQTWRRFFWRRPFPAHARRAERPAHGGHRRHRWREISRAVAGAGAHAAAVIQAVFGAADGTPPGRAARILLDQFDLWTPHHGP